MNLLLADLLVVIAVLTLAAHGSNEHDQPKYGRLKSQGCQKLLDSPSGQKAIEHLVNTSTKGHPMKDLADRFNKSEAEVTQMFKHDNSLRLDMFWESPANHSLNVFYVEDAPEPPSPKGEKPASNEGHSESVRSSFKTLATDAFALHSRPLASKAIYLDFDGHTITGTAWNSQYPTINAPPFDTDGDPSTFSTSERSVITSVWQRVAEDYAPFDVDVTTEYKGSEDFLTRSSSTDLQYGIRVLISPISAQICSTCGGIAYVGVFADVGDFYKLVLAFSDTLYGSDKYIAEVASHESGHSFGLHHDGTSTLAYYTGQGSGEVGWAPIMGTGYYKNLVQWSKGEYSGANNKEDDIAIISSNLPRRADDHGGTCASATPLAASSTMTAGGIVEALGDADVFSFQAAAGAVITVSVAVPAGLANLDAVATLLNAACSPVATFNPSTTLGVAAGKYTPSKSGTLYLKVTATGLGSPLSTGYSAYASLGAYTATITVASKRASPPHRTMDQLPIATAIPPYKAKA